MKKKDDLSYNLSKLFTNKKFFESMIQEGDSFDRLEAKMANVLCYYIATRDTNFDYTYEEILEKYDQIRNLDINGEYGDNVISNGFLTHSFNGYKRERIAKYGLDYYDKVDIEEKNKIDEMRKALNKLEQILGKSKFTEREEEYISRANADQVYLSTPGTKTIYYATQNSPERLYEGPIGQKHGELSEPIVLGEKKQDYMFRILEKKINDQYTEKDSKEYTEAIEIARKVVDYYCSERPAFAMVNIKDVKDIFVSNDILRDNFEGTLMERIYDEMGPTRNVREVEDFFSTKSCYLGEDNNMGNLVTLARFIPQDAISIVDMLDGFEMKQIFAKVKGLQIGDLIDYNSCQFEGKASIKQLIGILENLNTSSELESARQRYEDVKKSYTSICEKVFKKYSTLDRAEIEQKRQELISREKNILQRDYIRKDGIDENYTLADVLNELDKKGKMTELLKQDEIICNDELQYESNLHGVEHTRRVNFYANAIMNSSNTMYSNPISKSDEKIILEIIKNHDIGRNNDDEDKEHGEKSVEKLSKNPERLTEFSEEEKQIIQFVIKEHSLSAKENEEHLSQVPKPNRYKKILNVVKNADKLDRVRLDPRGVNLREGLDISRLSGSTSIKENSQKMENVAYEALDKVLEILDIRKELEIINEFMDLSKEKEGFDKFEEKFEKQNEKVKKILKFF